MSKRPMLAQIAFLLRMNSPANCLCVGFCRSTSVTISPLMHDAINKQMKQKIVMEHHDTPLLPRQNWLKGYYEQAQKRKNP